MRCTFRLAADFNLNANGDPEVHVRVVRKLLARNHRHTGQFSAHISYDWRRFMLEARRAMTINVGDNTNWTHSYSNGRNYYYFHCDVYGSPLCAPIASSNCSIIVIRCPLHGEKDCLIGSNSGARGTQVHKFPREIYFFWFRSTQQQQQQW